jgi:hypothetical protein
MIFIVFLPQNMKEKSLNRNRFKEKKVIYNIGVPQYVTFWKTLTIFNKNNIFRSRRKSKKKGNMLN